MTPETDTPPVENVEPAPPIEPGAGDKPPAKKKAGRPKGSKNKPKGDGAAPAKAPTQAAAIRNLRTQLDSLLKSPGFMFEMSGDKWAAEHVDDRGANLAAELAALAERNPEFRRRLEAFLEGGENSKLIFAAAMYVAPLAIYFRVLPAPERVRQVLQIPERATGGPAFDPNVMPPEIRRMAEKDAIENGFVFEDGSADVPAFLKAVAENQQEAAQNG